MIAIQPLVRMLGLAAFLALAAPTIVPAQENAASSDALPFELGGPWSLIDHHGQARSREDFHGEYRIVYFGYTNCPYTCSTAMINLAVVLDELADDGHEMGGLFFTIDPAYDSPERIADYLRPIHPRFLGLTGEAAEIEHLQKSFQVHAEEVADKGGFERLFDHQPLAFLMGPEGNILTLFPPLLPPFEIARIIHGYL